MMYIKFIGQLPEVELRFPHHARPYLFKGPDFISCMEDMDAEDLLRRGVDFIAVEPPAPHVTEPVAVGESDVSTRAATDPDPVAETAAKPEKRKYTRRK